MFKKKNNNFLLAIFVLTLIILSAGSIFLFLIRKTDLAKNGLPPVNPADTVNTSTEAAESVPLKAEREECESEDAAANDICYAEAAIKDAILYDGTCSAVSAMEYAEKAVQLVNDPGMDGMMRYLVKANQSRFILQNGVKDISELKKAGITTTFENSRYGSQIGDKDDEEHNPQSIIQMQLNIANQQTTESIVEAIGQQYAGGDNNKLETWKNLNKKSLTSNIDTQLIAIITGFRESLLSCSIPATQLFSDYLATETALQQANDSKITGAQIKRDQAFNKLEQINVEINGIGQHFQTLIGSLTKAGVQSVSANPPILSWDYKSLATDSKFATPATCPNPQ